MATPKSNQNAAVKHGLGYEIGRTLLLLAGTFFVVWLVVYIALKISTGL